MVASQCRCMHQECPDGSPLGTCQLLPGGFCFTYFEEVRDHGRPTHSIEKRLGCFAPGDDSLFQCKGYLSTHSVHKNISCCNTFDFCNEELLTEIIDGEIVFEEHHSLMANMDMSFIITIALSLLVFIFLASMLIKFLINKNYSKYIEKTKQLNNNNGIKKQQKINKNDDSNSQKLLPQSNFSSPLATNVYVYQYSYESDSNIPFVNISGSDGSSGGSSRMLVKNFSLNGSKNGSNYTIDSNNYCSTSAYHLSSITLNTTSSLMSENTQQTILSSQRTNTLPPLNEDSITSGSGSGVPRLVQKTIAREIDLRRPIGNGRFGTVYYGVRHCEECAVKIFTSHHESCWMKEVDIYQGTIMRHENIVTFVGADIISHQHFTELWLVTQYHKLGSLYDYLNQTSISNIEQMLDILKSIIFGLSHLHTEVNGFPGKTSIAHRDLKSKNILMKSDYSCCISDFASAITKTQHQIENNVVRNHYLYIQTGTIRYMAPEILADTINKHHFEEYLHADIYSLGLVFWEVFNRLEIKETARMVPNKYKKPYEEYFPNEMQIENMHEVADVVCKQKIRPQIRDLHDQTNPILLELQKLIEECWTEKPSARLPSLYFKKKIINLQKALYM